MWIDGFRYQAQLIRRRWIQPSTDMYHTIFLLAKPASRTIGSRCVCSMLLFPSTVCLTISFLFLFLAFLLRLYPPSHFSFFYPSFLSFNSRETLVVWTACIEQRSTISLFYHPRDENRVQSPMWYGLYLIQWYFVEYMKLLDFVLTEFLLFLIGSLLNILFQD